MPVDPPDTDRAPACGNRPATYRGPDPYIAEVFPEDNPPDEWWCDECFSERADDI